MPQMTFILVHDSTYIYFRLMYINLRLDSKWQTGRDSKARFFFFFSEHKAGSQPQGT